MHGEPSYGFPFALNGSSTVVPCGERQDEYDIFPGLESCNVSSLLYMNDKLIENYLAVIIGFAIQRTRHVHIGTRVHENLRHT